MNGARAETRFLFDSLWPKMQIDVIFQKRSMLQSLHRVSRRIANRVAHSFPSFRTLPSWLSEGTLRTPIPVVLSSMCRRGLIGLFMLHQSESSNRLVAQSVLSTVTQNYFKPRRECDGFVGQLQLRHEVSSHFKMQTDFGDGRNLLFNPDKSAIAEFVECADPEPMFSIQRRTQPVRKGYKYLRTTLRNEPESLAEQDKIWEHKAEKCSDRCTPNLSGSLIDLR